MTNPDIQQRGVQILDRMTREVFAECSFAEEVEALLRDLLALLSAGGSAPRVEPLTWQPIETAPRDGSAFRAYHPDLVHADFNPSGSVEACFDGEQIVGAVWNGCHDIWNTTLIEPTHWMPLPAPPSREEPSR